MTRPDFDTTDGVYRIAWGEPEYATVEFALLRSERSAVSGEVSVWATPEGLAQHLHTARVNLSSTRERTELARHLTKRSNGHSPDWPALVDMACERTILAYRAGEPAILLRDAVRPVDAGDLLPPLLLGRLPTVLFGDGGTAKSEIALAAAISIDSGAEMLGMTPAVTRRVAYLDWEMDDWTHRERADLLGGPGNIVYVPCRRPLAEDVDRLRRILRQRDIGYIVIDSVGVASDGPPEAAEVALRFFGAIRQLDRGALLIAHTTKQDEDRRPFGSAFWHNAARRTWYVTKQQDLGSDGLTVGLFNRKNNTGRLATPLGFDIRFEPTRTVIERSADVRDYASLAEHISVRERVRHALAAGALTYAEMADATGADEAALRQVIRRDNRRTFVELPNDGPAKRFGLKAPTRLEAV